jgi:hypothetical protein
VSEGVGLEDLQSWLGALITNPDGTPVVRASVENLIRSSPTLTAKSRLALYQRSYRQRHLEAIASFYPALRHMLGPELFNEFASSFLQERKPRAYSMSALAHGFADYLATARPDREASREAWASMIVDLARLEQIVAEVYDGPGPESLRLPTAADLSLLLTDARRAVVTEPVPSLRLVANPMRRLVAVSRRDYVVTLTSLTADQYMLLKGLGEGETFERVAIAIGLGYREAWSLFRRLVDLGFFAAVRRERDCASATHHRFSPPEKESMPA